ncbi:MAG: fibronectin type III domain-containing protein, partial [bacterium]
WHLRDTEIEEAMTGGFQQLVKEAVPDPGLAGYEQAGEIRSLNVTMPRPLLGIGDRIAVEVRGEESRKAYFDVGQVRRRIPMEEVNRGLYRGVYTVQVGDNTDYAVVRAYFLPEETKPPASKTQVRAVFAIDTTLPSPSAITAYHFTADSIVLSLKPVEGKDFEAYWIYRREGKGEYWRLGKTEKPQYEDDSTKPGRTYSYLIRTRDRAGNETVSAQPFAVTVPQHGPTALPSQMTGEVVLHAYSSPYRFGGEVNLAPGSSIRLDPGCVLQATSKESRIVVNGKLEARGLEEDEPVLLTGPQGWKGLVFDSDQPASLYCVTIEKAARAFTLNKGEATVERCNLLSNETAIQTDSGTSLKLRRTLITGNDTGALIRGALATVEGCNFLNNRYGILFTTPSAQIRENNFVSTNLSLLYFGTEPVGLGPNCFDTVKPVDLARQIGGRILMTSVLDGPPPDGVETLVASKEEWAELTQQAEEAEKSKDLRKARRALAKLRFLGAERDFFLRLSWLTEQIDGADDALPLARSAAVAFPEDRNVLYNYGRVLIEAGEIEEAEVTLKRMRDLFGPTSEEDALRRKLVIPSR